MFSWTFFHKFYETFLIAIVDLCECSKILLIRLTQDQTGGKLLNQGLTGSFFVTAVIPELYN